MRLVTAAFDFDGTITKKDSFLDFVLRSCDFKQLFWGALKSLPVLFLYIFRIFTANKAKERIFGNFFKNFPEEKFNQLCKEYSLSWLLKIIRKQALQKIQWHQAQGHKLVIVSASMENWIKPWAEQNGFEKVISTIPETQDGILTGRFKTKNCNREEKAKRFLAEYPNRKDYYLCVYGDNSKDEWLFQIADEKFYRSF